MAVDSNLDPHHALPAGGRGEATITDPAHLLPEHASDTRGSSTGRRIRNLVILLLIAGVIAFIVWRIRSNDASTTAENRRSAMAANRAIPVQVSAVQQKTVPVYLTALGTVTAYNTVTLHSRVDGQLLQVNFREGQAVRKGQLLLQIDPRPYQATLDQAIGNYARDQANLKNAQAQAQRYTSLYEAGVVSKEQQQTQVSTAGQAEGTLQSDQAAIEAAKVNLGYTRIYAPIDGVAGLRLVDPGNIVHASDSTGLVVITQVHPISVIFTLPEDQLPQVQDAMRGNKLVVEAYDRTDAHKIASGTLLTIDNQIDTTTGTAKLKAVFQNADDSLFPNQFVNVRLILRNRPDATLVPTAAIQSGTQGTFVFVVNPGPTPENKKQNQPGATEGGASGQGRGGRRGKGGSDGSAATPHGVGETASGDGGKQTGNGRQGGGGPPPCPAGPQHADAVPVHVDFALGTNSVLADGALHGGQQVVVDGAEKLIDGGNVCPQQGRGNAPVPNNTVGAGRRATSDSPQQPGGVNGGTPTGNPQPNQNAGQPSSSATPSNGGGHQ